MLYWFSKIQWRCDLTCYLVVCDVSGSLIVQQLDTIRREKIAKIYAIYVESRGLGLFQDLNLLFISPLFPCFLFLFEKTFGNTRVFKHSNQTRTAVPNFSILKTRFNYPRMR